MNCPELQFMCSATAGPSPQTKWSRPGLASSIQTLRSVFQSIPLWTRCMITWCRLRAHLMKTVLGILKLKNSGQRVEIRVVLHAITAPRIVATCQWLARNLPFLDHVALMGLENTGFAKANEKALWIDPVDYQDLLAEAVDWLIA